MLLDSVPLPLMFLGVFMLTFLCVEGGFRLGRRVRSSEVREMDATAGSMSGATLGLLAFMLAFTFGMAESRYDRRRSAVVDEATRIEKAYLLAQLLPAAQAQATAPLLREYVDLRVAAVADPSTYARALTRSEELHRLLWSQVRSLPAEYSESEIVALYVGSLNDVIEMHTRRLGAAVRARIPGGVWLTLGVLTLISMLTLGYQNGLVSPVRSRAAIMLVLAYSITMHLIIDLDRPQQGFVRVGQKAMLDVQRRLHATP
jgi:hypothetical protein